MKLIVIIGICLAVSVFLNIVFPWGVKWFIRRRFLRRTAQSKNIYLTFDDGPDPVTTPKILQLLNDANAKATFFVVGHKVRKYPELVKQILKMGHEIGSHGYHHIHPWKSLPFRALNDFIRGNKEIGRFIHPDDKLIYRPPFGKLNFFTLTYAFFHRIPLAFWNIDPKDYNQERVENLLQYIMQRLSAGSVILLHDGRENADNDAGLTALGLQKLLDEIASNQINFAGLSEVFND